MSACRQTIAKCMKKYVKMKDERCKERKCIRPSGSETRLIWLIDMITTTIHNPDANCIPRTEKTATTVQARSSHDMRSATSCDISILSHSGMHQPVLFFATAEDWGGQALSVSAASHTTAKLPRSPASQQSSFAKLTTTRNHNQLAVS